MRKITCLLVLALAGSAWSADTAKVKFHLRNNFLILVSGSIGSLDELTFVVDTGTARTVVDAGVARQLGIGTGRPALSYVAGQTQVVRRVDIPELRFGPVSAARLSVLVMDLDSLSRSAGKRIDAIVGLDVLHGRNFLIDYRRRQLEFGAVEARGQAMPFDPASPYLVVTAHVNGEPVRLLVDTGADQLVLFADRLHEVSQRTTQAASGFHASGGVKGEVLPNVDVRFGNWHLPNVLLFLISGESDFRAYDGHLGPRVLGAARLYFDFQNRELRAAN